MRRRIASGGVPLSSDSTHAFRVSLTALPDPRQLERSRPRILVTVPVHNEEGVLLESVRRLDARLRSAGLDYQIAIAEDGSDDGTGSEIARLEQEIPDLVVQRMPRRMGRGAALRALWPSIDADIYAFLDADLPVEPEALGDLVRAIQEGADVVTGSRYCPGATVHRPPVRSLVSLVYNGLVRFLFHEPLRDHQCGLKAFRRDAVQVLLRASHEDSWAWDTEVLVLAHHLRFQVVEVPVDWTEHRYRRTPVRRLWSDIRLHGTFLIRLRSEIGRRVRESDAEATAGRRLTTPSELSEGSYLPAARGLQPPFTG